MKVAGESEEVYWSHPEFAPAWAAQDRDVIAAVSQDASDVASYLHGSKLSTAGLLDDQSRQDFEVARAKFVEVQKRLRLSEDTLTEIIWLAEEARRESPVTEDFRPIHDKVLSLAEALETYAFVAIAATWLACLNHTLLVVLEPTGTA